LPVGRAGHTRRCESSGNYLHRLDDIKKNHESFANDGVVDASIAVLLKNEGDGCSICG
jgi:hypothetical protein